MTLFFPGMLSMTVRSQLCFQSSLNILNFRENTLFSTFEKIHNSGSTISSPKYNPLWINTDLTQYATLYSGPKVLIFEIVIGRMRQSISCWSYRTHFSFCAESNINSTIPQLRTHSTISCDFHHFQNSANHAPPYCWTGQWKNMTSQKLLEDNRVVRSGLPGSQALKSL